MKKFLFLFVVIQAVLFGLQLAKPVQAALVNPWTQFLASVSAGIVHLFDSQVRSYGVIIESLRTGFAVEIHAGCNGVEATIVLIAAMLAFPASWRHRAIGLAIGFVAVQGLNLVRIISLFYLGQWNRTAFEWAHLYLWQALIMLDVLIVWLVWIRMLPKRASVEPPAPPPPPAPAAA